MASVNSSDWRAVREKFTTVLHLTELKSLSDPENDPFRSKYEARELLREIYSSLKSFEASEETDGGERGEEEEEREEEQAVDGEKDAQRRLDGDSPAGLRTAKLAAVEYYLGVNHAETEENRLGILWSVRDETETAQGFLETAEAIYQRYMKEDGSPPTDMTEYFSTEENQITHQERTNRFELVYTFTLYYLAQVYKYIGETERAATYCHSTLQRQLQLNKFNPMEWALNAATLSQYYITKVRFHSLIGLPLLML
ncbi:hypothetical protein CRUP_007404 [Coryphaenoides rupestris]|nr:hypothetical protein CRUP_007404 [Coryphaenoides rupestris]